MPHEIALPDARLVNLLVLASSGAEDYRQLEELMNVPLRTSFPPELHLNTPIDVTELAEGVAVQERRRLGLGDQPVVHLRTILEWDVGLRIFYGRKGSSQGSVEHPDLRSLLPTQEFADALVVAEHGEEGDGSVISALIPSARLRRRRYAARCA